MKTNANTSWCLHSSFSFFSNVFVTQAVHPVNWRELHCIVIREVENADPESKNAATVWLLLQVLLLYRQVNQLLGCRLSRILSIWICICHLYVLHQRDL